MDEQVVGAILKRLDDMERRLSAMEMKLAPPATRVAAGFEMSFVDMRNEIAEFKAAFPRSRNERSTEVYYRECVSELVEQGKSREQATEFLRSKAVEYARSKEGAGQYARGSDVWLRERAYKENWSPLASQRQMFDF